MKTLWKTNTEPLTTLKDLQEMVDDAERAESFAHDAAGCAANVVDAARRLIREMPTVEAMADAVECFALPLKAVDIRVEDGRGRVVATCETSDQAGFVAMAANAVGGF